MSEQVQILWFVQEREECDDIELLIGVYETKEAAEAAIDRLRNKRGFVDFPEGFLIEGYELGKDNWTEGFFIDGD